MKILSQNDPSFSKYGKILNNVDCSAIIEELSKVEIPENVVYLPGVEALEKTNAYDAIKSITYGESDIQIGYCIGHNELLNAVEYHRSSEVNIFATDAILILGKREDIEDDFSYDTSKMEAFLFKKGTAAEIYATALHYAPCGVDGAGFLVAVVLPLGTNYPLDNKHASIDTVANDEDKLITAKIKWLIYHPDAKGEAGHFPGLKGINLNVNK